MEYEVSVIDKLNIGFIPEGMSSFIQSPPAVPAPPAAPAP